MSQLSVDLLKSLIDEPAGKPTKSADVRRADNAASVARHRQAEQVRRDAGIVNYSVPAARDALADAAMQVLISGGGGAEIVRSVLASIFSTQVGAPMTIESHVRSGKINAKFFKSSRI